MSLATTFRIVVRAAQKWSANNDSRLGAALAYYALFSIAPVIVLAVMIAGAVFGDDAARGHVETQMRDFVGPESALTIQKLVESAAQPKAGAWASFMSIAVLVIGALSMFLHVRGSLCTIWNLTPPRDNSWLGLLLDYTLALVMVIFCGVFLLASLAAGMLVTYFKPTLDDWVPGLAWEWIEAGLSFLYLTILFACMYRILSGGRIGWGYVIYGSFIAAVLFTFGKKLLGWYFAFLSTESVYGAAGALVLFLMWVYYSSQILFFGAELIQARRTRAEWMASGDVAKATM